MSKCVLITGASGLLGSAILNSFKGDKSYTVVGLSHSRRGGNLVQVDLTAEGEASRVIHKYKPSIVIHCAAERRPDVVEKDEIATRKLNVTTTEELCQNARYIGAHVLYISTDYVFDGTSPPYKTDDAPKPINKYGLSKAEGERVTMAVSKENIVLRIPILYGHIEKLSESAVTVLYEKVRNTSDVCTMSDYEIRYPTHCEDLAHVIHQITDRKLQNPEAIHGIYHWSGLEPLTKYTMSTHMANIYGITTDHIKPDKSPAEGAPRPYDCHLDCSRLTELGIVRHTPFVKGIKEVLDTFMNQNV